jgi:thiamine pyrophosphokinase
MKAVVVAHGDAVAADRAVAVGADLLIAADGGALHCAAWDLVPHVVIGDLDSLPLDRQAELRRANVRVLAHPAAKDESDTELAVRCALDHGADEIVLVGALGGLRVDHAIANMLLLASSELRGRDVSAVRDATIVRALHGGERLVLSGTAGDVVTLLALGADARGVRTEGLRYTLDGEDLRAGAARGLSNVVERAPAAVALAQGVLVVVQIGGGAS